MSPAGWQYLAGRMAKRLAEAGARVSAKTAQLAHRGGSGQKKKRLRRRRIKNAALAAKNISVQPRRGAVGYMCWRRRISSVNQSARHLTIKLASAHH